MDLRSSVSAPEAVRPDSSGSGSFPGQGAGFPGQGRGAQDVPASAWDWGLIPSWQGADSDSARLPRATITSG